MLVTKYFTSNSSWTAPAGVASVILIGSGGGGGGASGAKSTDQAGGGGGGAWQMTTIVNVVPNTAYTVTIGGGGTGGAATTGTSGNVGSNGSDTTFGSLATFKGAGYAIGQSNTSAGGLPVSGNPYWQEYTGGYYPAVVCPGSGGQTDGPGSMVRYPGGGSYSYIGGYVAGTMSANSGSYEAGAGGGGGCQGNGGNGGTSNSGGAGGSGTAGTANTGAGGGGGGSGSTQGGAGGNGGSGYLYVIWSE